MNYGRASSVIDFYVRLPAPALLATSLCHLESGIDTDAEDEGAFRAFESASALPGIRGFTEWVAGDAPAVSVGWDWMLTGPGTLALDRNSIRTNLMLVDPHGVDRGQEATVLSVIALIERTDWQAVVLQALQAQGGT